MRSLRTLKKGASYLVSSKVLRDFKDLTQEKFKSLFLDVVKRAKKKYKFSIKNFIIMNNFFRFIVEPLENESLSRIMQLILSIFARKFNKLNGYSGCFWKTRFWSKIIENINELKKTFDEITNYPVINNIVNDAKDYKFGGRYFIQQGTFDIIDKPD
jgi:putative transposase